MREGTLQQRPRAAIGRQFGSRHWRAGLHTILPNEEPIRRWCRREARCRLKGVPSDEPIWLVLQRPESYLSIRG